MRIEEAKALAVIRSLDATLAELGLPSPQREQARALMAKQLRALA